MKALILIALIAASATALAQDWERRDIPRTTRDGDRHAILNYINQPPAPAPEPANKWAAWDRVLDRVERQHDARPPSAAGTWEELDWHNPVEVGGCLYPRNANLDQIEILTHRCDALKFGRFLKADRREQNRHMVECANQKKGSMARYACYAEYQEKS